MNVTIDYEAVRELASRHGYIFSMSATRLDAPPLCLYEDLPNETCREALTTGSIGDVCRFLGLEGITSLERDGRPLSVRPVVTRRYIYDEAGELVHTTTGDVALGMGTREVRGA